MLLTRLILTGSVALTLFTTAQAASGDFTSQFMEDNDLWMEDSLDYAPNVSQEAFNLIIDAGLATYKPFADANNETLRINRNWTDSTVNANCQRSGGRVTINMYGGLARRDEVTPDGFALVMCHEIAHAYGGAPYIQPTAQMSAEGQADYYGAQTCIDKVYEIIARDLEEITVTPFMQQKCAEKTGTDAIANALCLRGLAAGQSLGHLLSKLSNDKTPNYETPDPTVVPRTLTSYPKTTQCRLDTYLNGVLDLPRPACWFKN